MCEVRKIINQRIEELCKEKKLTLYSLSGASGVPLTTLVHIMDGSTRNPGILTIVKICNGLQMTLGEFFDIPEFADVVSELNEE